jgi:PAS domain S-box-containing protein
MLVDQSAIVCKFTPDGRITYVNDKLCEISGYTPDRPAGRMTLRNSTMRASRPRTPETHWSSCGAAHAGRVSSENATARVSLLVVESSLVPILDEHGAVAEVVSLDVDVTERYKVYENLVETLSTSNRSFAEQHHFFAEYKRALELGSCICVTDRQHRIISTNQQFETLIGYRAGELKGRHVGKVIMPDVTAERCLDQVQQANKEHFASRSSPLSGQRAVKSCSSAWALWACITPRVKWSPSS